MGSFFCPCSRPQEIYRAIGRLRRYDQTKTAYIRRFLTKDTIGVHIYEARTGKYLYYNILHDS